jgi:hypothetical protein
VWDKDYTGRPTIEWINEKVTASYLFSDCG